MRIESYFPTISFDYSQWYVNCAHVNIIGPGGGTPTGFARFPGTYSIYDPGKYLYVSSQIFDSILGLRATSILTLRTYLGLWIPKDQFVNGGYVKDADMKLFDYKAPGPAVWTG